MKIKENFTRIYSPLANDFVDLIKDVNYNNIPEPFLPVIGSNYENSKLKFVFVGMETRSYGNISDFVNHCKTNLEEALFREEEEFNDLDYTGWMSNFGNNFWAFVLKFLANYYNIDNWKKLKNQEYPEILRSFIWGNVNAIERFEITAQKKGVLYNDWIKVKQASKCFDKGQHILNATLPDFMIILNWTENEEWLTNGVNSGFIKEEIQDHLLYYKLPDFKTHILWTAHPTWLSKNKDFDNFVKECSDFIKVKLID